MALYISALIFLTYTSVFAFRKPFTVAGFEGRTMLGLPYQTLLIISQVIGYMLSKFVGIRFISALRRTGRWRTSAILIGTSWLALMLFALMPAWMGPLLFMINGFCLGFMWGIVFSYVEGRRATDLIGSVLAVSFIFAGGFTRSVGKYLMLHLGVSEYWMPFLTGAVFAVPLVILFYLLEKAPHPDADDRKERMERVSMNAGDRSGIFSAYRTGLVIIAISYGLLTVIRDLRDNYMGNMWNELGYGSSASVFATSETRISLVILCIMALLVLVRSNILAFRLIHVLVAAGFVLSGAASIAFLSGKLDGAVWMQTVGLGLYMSYIPFNAVFFDRMIASFRIRGNAGFLMYFIDAFGYLGSVTVMLVKEFASISVKWSAFYSQLVVVFAFVGFVGTLYSLAYFTGRYRKTAS